MDGIDLKIAIELSPFKVRFSRVGKEILEIVINLEACKQQTFLLVCRPYLLGTPA